MSRSKQTGTAAETAVVGFLQANGFPFAERRTMHGKFDQGDVSGVPGAVLEIKATKTFDLAGAVREAKAEAANAGVDVWAVVLKAPGKGVANVDRWYFITELGVGAGLLK